MAAGGESDVAAGGLRVHAGGHHDVGGSRLHIDRPEAGLQVTASVQSDGVLSEEGDVAGSGLDRGIGGDVARRTLCLEQNVAGAVRVDRGGVGGRRAVVQRDRAVDRAQDNRAVAAGGHEVGETGGILLRRGGASGEDAVSRHRADGVHSDVGGVDHVDPASSAGGSEGDDLGLEGVRAGAEDTDVGGGRQSEGIGVNVDEGGGSRLRVGDRAGAGGNADRAPGALSPAGRVRIDECENHAGAGRVADVLVGGLGEGEGRRRTGGVANCHRDRAGGGLHIDRARASSDEVALNRRADVVLVHIGRADDRDVAGRRGDLGVEREATGGDASLAGLQPDIAGAVRCDGTASRVCRAVVEGETTVECDEDDVTVVTQGRQVALRGVGRAGHHGGGRVGGHALHQDSDVIDSEVGIFQYINS